MKKKAPHASLAKGEFKDVVVDELKADASFREEYLKGLLREQDLPMLALGLRDLVEALGGIGKVSAATGLNRQNLYKAFSGKVRPDFPTLVKIINYAGYDLSVEKKQSKRPHSRTLILAH